ncbi:DUF2868 domain-containing protein [Castellaniella sp.]|uniref:DUF2868 domain-containing protein n=1 Tax=Castellaniella sp. TaxID=1955812 RepID=UPI002AFE247D|nr:DUF2868 domain-containing protein [Castellaniella sp.]
MEHPTATSPSGSPLQQHWRAEAVRLREAHWGPLEDAAACQAALRQPADLQQRILARAAWLAARGSLQTCLQQWTTGARWALLALWLSAGLAGVGAAISVLGNPTGTVNLALALLGLLGLHALMFLIWLIGCLPGWPAGGTTLSHAWLWLTRKIVRGPDAALVAQAFLSLLSRTHAWKPALGLLSHGAWIAVFAGAIPTLLILLSTRSYTFYWETTLLSPDAFLAFSQWLGSVPHWLGFPLPSELSVAQSMAATPAPAAVQTQWSWWLIGCLLAWGVLPRVLGLIACGLWLHRRIRQLHVDPDLPGWLELRDRLLPTHQILGVDRPAGRADARLSATRQPYQATRHAAIMAYELGPDILWPPADLPDAIDDLGRCDSRADRVRIRQMLPTQHLLLVCDARLTPDRGAAVWFNELRHVCADFQILCLEGSPARRQVWQQALSQHSLPQASSLASWLEHLGNPSP